MSRVGLLQYVTNFVSDACIALVLLWLPDLNVFLVWDSPKNCSQHQWILCVTILDPFGIFIMHILEVCKIIWPQVIFC